MTGRPSRWHHEFEVTSEFADQLALLIPSAPLRLAFLERGVFLALDRLLMAHRADPAGARGVLILGDEGFLQTAAGIPGAGECLIWFGFDPDPQGSRRVRLIGIGRAGIVDRPDESAGA